MNQRGQVTERDCWACGRLVKTNDEVTEVTEKRLAYHVRQIKDKKGLATVKQEEIALRVNIEHQQVETTEPSTTETLHHVARTPDIQEEKC